MKTAMKIPSTLKPAEVAVAMVQAAVAKHKDRYDVIFFKAFMAGVMLSFGAVFAEIVGGGSSGLTQQNPGLAKVLSAFVFPSGLVMILLQGHELLTSNMMVFPMAVMTRAIPIWGLPVNWMIVFFGNLAGSLFAGGILVKFSGILSAAPYPDYIKTFAINKAMVPAWHQIFLRGIGCNWLVCIGFWQAAGARDTVSKVFAMWIPIWIFVSCSFDHVIANMTYIPLGIMFGAPMTVADYIKKSLFASFFGNIVGALFVGAPATYFYLRDYDARGLRASDLETGEAAGERQVTDTRTNSSDNVPAKQY